MISLLIHEIKFHQRSFQLF
uniref:Uncharacterized protein n=1 Tax=Wuchereria bancrofti TaxID=6293 RepID=A0A1I8EPH6_WUCBA